MAENSLSPKRFEDAIDDLSRRLVGERDLGGQFVLALARQALRGMKLESLDSVTPARFADIILSADQGDLRVRYGLLDLADHAYGPDFQAETHQIIVDAETGNDTSAEAAS